MTLIHCNKGTCSRYIPSHRTDEEEFYRRVTFRTRRGLVRELRDWEHEYNHRRLHLAIAAKTPAERLAELRISLTRGVLRSAHSG